ncbi:MAG TPA: radical SAM protein, partial [Planctomycetota bacterium]|nr:radical SAM protein [Planctomycetota bacterium]
MDDNARGDERIGSLGGSFEARAGSSRELAGVYLHVPFCSAICPYCDFAVTTGSRRARQEFAATLLEEIRLHEWFREPADTIYLGGGTPSALDDDALAAILDTLRATLAISSDAIVSLEANPEDVERARLDRWKSLGVSTVSLGVQSFKDEELRFLARRHDALRARESVELALEAGFRTVSVDLIFGLPGQRRSALDGNLDEIAALAPHHVSLYQLTIHSETPFARYRD